MTLQLEGWREIVQDSYAHLHHLVTVGKLVHVPQSLWEVRLLKVDCCENEKYKLTVSGIE